MSARPASVRYHDVLQAAAYARTIIARGRAAFDEDVTLRLAGERVIEMLAEAVNAVVEELEKAYPDYPWHEPVGMRSHNNGSVSLVSQRTHRDTVVT